MAEEPSAKRHHAETSDKRSNLVDINVPREKRDYTGTLKGVELHDKETLEIVCTSEPDKADEMTSRLRRKGGGLYPSFIGVDVEYTDDEKSPQMAAVLQLCVEELCLVYHIAAATKWPKRLKDFLQEEKLYTFVGFSIGGDKRMLEKSGLEINPNNFIDMQRKWKDPKTDKYYDSLADVAGGVIHPVYEGMKKKMNREDHKLWGNSPLPDNLITYTGIDAYTTYKSWKTIDNIVTGWDSSKEQEADPYYHCNFADADA
ncbi:hypothetical protein CFC21_040511 [Triticum aestivum]|uniref:3'-5' exonuclease domain-containing protein n=2 Tax=Triticum aestivum TaxID=4565 RepID=A0A9R1FGS8_WHEAT|nr:hypothetical protein CFC21_040511 [Triticum aestivum]CDM82132.1 unnamed protein product [Triticum aestivum]